jgi:phytoene/squalene synthetase
MAIDVADCPQAASSRAGALAAERATLAARMTRRASAQTYATIRLLADRDRAGDAMRAYAYFRWADDRLDDPTTPPVERAAFLARQQWLLEAGYRGYVPAELSPEEALLADLVAGDDELDSGLRSYLTHMMAVMAFDVARRGRAVSAADLDGYSDTLATAVADALFHFIGHDRQPPRGPGRAVAVRGAHIVHMLRDMVEDVALGYVNLPAEFLAENRWAAEALIARGLSDAQLDSPALRDWVAGRVRQARADFAAGHDLLATLHSRRCRLACRAYIARFEWVAQAIERDAYRLRPAYPERTSAAAAVWMVKRIAN